MKKLERTIKKNNLKPRLAVVLIGNDKASKLYVRLKAKVANQIGVDFSLFKFSSKAKEREILKLLKHLNKDKKTNGIIVQLPLPGKLRTEKIIREINPEKDADGFHPENIKNFLARRSGTEPVFPRAIMALIESTGLKLPGKKAVVIANSEIFGRVMRAALSRKKISAQAILSQELTPKRKLIERADVVVSAVGKPRLITGDMIKKGALIIDGGIARKRGKTLGDVDFGSVAGKAGWLSPVPGGVGPVTVAYLLSNVCHMAKNQKK